MDNDLDTITISKKEYEELIKIKEKYEELKKIKEKFGKVINCINGENKGRCNISDFLPCDIIPEEIKSRLSSVNQLINEKFPITLDILYKKGEPCNNQTLGNQIPNKLKEYIHSDEELNKLLRFDKMKWSGYPDEKVKVNGISIPLLWEWKSMYSIDGAGVRIVISKFPNKRIPLSFNECDEKYHLWVCLEYNKVQDNENSKTEITITKMNIHCISPNTILNTKFEISTTEQIIKEEISKGNITKV
jgi:hypothetical protein